MAGIHLKTKDPKDWCGPLVPKSERGFSFLLCNGGEGECYLILSSVVEIANIQLLLAYKTMEFSRSAY